MSRSTTPADSPRHPAIDLLARYREQLEHWSQVEDEQRELSHVHAGIELADWLGGLRRNADG